MRRSTVIGVLCVVLLGCPASEKTDAAFEVDAGAPDAAIIDAGPPPPATLSPTVTAALADGGAAPVNVDVQLDSVTALTVSLPIKLKDFRVRLMDWQDKLVPSDDELLADGKTYVLTPVEPLKTGRGYVLQLDAELGPIVTDDSGATWNDWELPFRIAGEVQPEPGAKKPLKNKKKSR